MNGSGYSKEPALQTSIKQVARVANARQPENACELVTAPPSARLSSDSDDPVDEIGLSYNSRIYPNPANTELTIELGACIDDLTEFVNVSIHSSNGRVIKEFNSTCGQKETVDIKGLSSGVYSAFIVADCNHHILKFVILR